MRDLRILIISLSWLYTKELTFRRYDFYKYSGVYLILIYFHFYLGGFEIKDIIFQIINK